MSSNVIINGKSVAVPKGFFDVSVKAAFGENIQSNLTTEEFIFVLDAYEEIMKWISDGLKSGVGILEGIPFSIVTSNSNFSQSIFQGIIDLAEGHTIYPNLGQIKTRIKQTNSLNSLSDLIEPLDFNYLKSKGVIKSSDYVDINYVVDPIDNTVATVTTFVTIYLLSKQLADTIKDFGEKTATGSGIAASGALGPVGATIYAVAVAILQVAYAATLLVLIIGFGTGLLDAVIQIKRTHKGVLLKTLLSKTCEYVGFGFETSIPELSYLTYLPSNISVDQFGAKAVLKKKGVITEGIPNVSDYGYRCTDLFQLCKELFNARFAIVDGVVQFHSDNSPYWLKNSTYVKPPQIADQANKSARFNTEEIISSRLLQFATDVSDVYTIKEYKGNAYQVLTRPKATQDKKNVVLKGTDMLNFQVALGSRKDELNEFEKGLAGLAGLFDKIADVFGKNPHLAAKVKNKIGVLRVSNNNHSVPKLLYLSGGRMPSNHRDLFSAKTLYDRYHNYKSPVANNYGYQRKIIENETIPFGLSDFVKLLKSSYFRDENGRLGKIISITGNFSKDKAVIDYWVPEIYTKNLEETFIEPS